MSGAPPCSLEASSGMCSEAVNFFNSSGVILFLSGWLIRPSLSPTRLSSRRHFPPSTAPLGRGDRITTWLSDAHYLISVLLHEVAAFLRFARLQSPSFLHCPASLFLPSFLHCSASLFLPSSGEIHPIHGAMHLPMAAYESLSLHLAIAAPPGPPLTPHPRLPEQPAAGLPRTAAGAAGRENQGNRVIGRN